MPGGLGSGYCFHHRQGQVRVGNTIAKTASGTVDRMRASTGKFAYRLATDTRLGEIMGAMGAVMTMPDTETGVVHVDLTFELAAARAMLALFMEYHGQREDALLTWHREYQAGNLPSPPPKVLSILDGHKAVVGIASLAQTMHAMQQSVPRDKFMRILHLMGSSVQRHVACPVTRAAIRQDFLNAGAEYLI